MRGIGALALHGMRWIGLGWMDVCLRIEDDALGISRTTSILPIPPLKAGLDNC